MSNKCDQCGICCKLFYINLNEAEYLSGRFQTVFDGMEKLNFKEASKCGANFLAKRRDGSCIYLKDNLCSIHAKRPFACKQFFCKAKNKKHKAMREIIAEYKNN